MVVIPVTGQDSEQSPSQLRVSALLAFLPRSVRPGQVHAAQESMEQVWSNLRIILWFVKTGRRVDFCTFVGLTNITSEASQPTVHWTNSVGIPRSLGNAPCGLGFIAGALRIFNAESERIVGGDANDTSRSSSNATNLFENKGRDGVTGIRSGLKILSNRVGSFVNYSNTKTIYFLLAGLVSYTFLT